MNATVFDPSKIVQLALRAVAQRDRPVRSSHKRKRASEIFKSIRRVRMRCGLGTARAPALSSLNIPVLTFTIRDEQNTN